MLTGSTSPDVLHVKHLFFKGISDYWTEFQSFCAEFTQQTRFKTIYTYRVILYEMLEAAEENLRMNQPGFRIQASPIFPSFYLQ